MSSDLVDPEGTYLAFISSPEDGIFTTHRFDLQVPWTKFSEMQALVNNARDTILIALTDITGALENVAKDGDMQTLLGRLTETRATMLDNLHFLDAAVSGENAAANAAVVADAIIDIEIVDEPNEDIEISED